MDEAAVAASFITHLPPAGTGLETTTSTNLSSQLCSFDSNTLETSSEDRQFVQVGRVQYTDRWILEVDKEVFDRWCVVGISEGLSSDASIATFLIEQYEKTHSGAHQQTAHCANCRMPLGPFCYRCVRSSLPQKDQAVTANISCEIPEVPESSRDLVKHGTSVSGQSDQDREFQSQKESERVNPRSPTVPSTLSSGGHCGSELVNPLMLTPPSAQLRGGQCEHKRVNASTGSNDIMPPVQGSKTQNHKTDISDQHSAVTEPNKNGQNEERAPETNGAFGPEDKLQTSGASVRRSIRNLQTPGAPVSKQKPKCVKKKLKSNGSQLKSNENRAHECDLCSASFYRRSNLIAHLLRHGVKTPHKCQQCPAQFRKFTELKAHERETHTGGKTFYDCSLCGASFKHAFKLKEHVRRHRGEKPFVCDFCGLGFITAADRNIHHRSHTGEKPFQCSVCGKTFARSGCLSVHKRTHLTDKPHVCSQCGRAFRHHGHLKDHMKTHSGQRPYQCEVCGKAMAHKSTLKYHMRTHTGQKPYACPVCEKTFSTCSNMWQHRRTHKT